MSAVHLGAQGVGVGGVVGAMGQGRMCSLGDDGDGEREEVTRIRSAQGGVEDGGGRSTHP